MDYDSNLGCYSPRADYCKVTFPRDHLTRSCSRCISHKYASFERKKNEIEGQQFENIQFSRSPTLYYATRDRSEEFAIGEAGLPRICYRRDVEWTLKRPHLKQRARACGLDGRPESISSSLSVTSSCCSLGDRQRKLHARLGVRRYGCLREQHLRVASLFWVARDGTDAH